MSSTGSANKRARVDDDLPRASDDEGEEAADDTGAAALVDGDESASGSGSGSPVSGEGGDAEGASPSAGIDGSGEPMAIAESDEEDSTPAARKLSTLNRQIRTLTRERKEKNDELTKYKLALANCNNLLQRNSIAIPDNCKVVGGVVDSGETPNSQRALMLSTRPVSESNLGKEDWPYRWELTGLPDTSTVITDTKFDIKVTSFPHAVCRYSRTSEKFAPHVEARRPIPLTWKLVNRQDPSISCSEADLKPSVAQPKIKYRLKLVYADDGTEVTMESLTPQAQHIGKLSEPNIIGSSIERVQGGAITFRIKKLNVLSSMTKPLHRKFRFELTCLDEDLKGFEHMHASTFDFYSVARLRPK